LASSQGTHLPPQNIDDLNCAELDVRIIDLGPDLLTPGKVDLQKAFAALMSNPELMKRIREAETRDPNNLCHYREANRALRASSDCRVIFLGDSITENWGRAAPELFDGEIINRGISGQNTAQMLARFRFDVLDLSPRVVHIMAGLNDICIPSGTTLTISNIISMVELARASNVRVVLGAITPSNQFWLFPNLAPVAQIVALNKQLREYVSKQHVEFVDYHLALAGDDGGIRDDLSNEGLHPNRNGYAIMTPLARAAVNRALR
jgi:lysophospholipase L1-like esterase